MGNFDGVHRGHQKILAEVNKKAAELGVKSLLICFEPQPKEFFDAFNAPARLTRFREKVDLLAEHGIDYVLCLPFNEQTRSTPAAVFIDMLVTDLKVGCLYVGDDFRFGHDRSGNYEQLVSAGKENGFEVFNLYTISYGEERISSTRIRECLGAGDFELAEKLLGYPYSITGKVVYGRQLGRTLDVPTANVQLHRDVAPIAGVYACEVHIAGELVKGVANVGVRPTVEEGAVKPILEVHLFDFEREIYGTLLKVVFRHKIRDEQKFESIDALKERIHTDIKEARSYFGGQD